MSEDVKYKVVLQKFVNGILKEEDTSKYCGGVVAICGELQDGTMQSMIRGMINTKNIAMTMIYVMDQELEHGIVALLMALLEFKICKSKLTNDELLDLIIEQFKK
jgi:hypothetical protein